jgi:hypothetical protein
MSSEGCPAVERSLYLMRRLSGASNEDNYDYAVELRADDNYRVVASLGSAVDQETADMDIETGRRLDSRRGDVEENVEGYADYVTAEEELTNPPNDEGDEGNAHIDIGTNGALSMEQYVQGLQSLQLRHRRATAAARR